MPQENTTIFIPFRLRDKGGKFQDDAVVGNYDLTVLRDGAAFAPAGGFTITALANLGRHIVSFVAGTEAQYILFIDHTATNRIASIDSATIFPDEFLSGDLRDDHTAILAALAANDAAAVADAVWDEVLAGHLTAGSAGKFVTRILQLSEPDVTINPTTNKIEVKDRATGEVLIDYDVTGIIDTRITLLDAPPTGP